MKLRSEIKWWFPCGISVVYSGTPKTRWMWIRYTWRAYIAFWQIFLRVAWLTVTRPDQRGSGEASE